MKADEKAIEFFRYCDLWHQSHGPGARIAYIALCSNGDNLESWDEAYSALQLKGEVYPADWCDTCYVQALCDAQDLAERLDSLQWGIWKVGYAADGTIACHCVELVNRLH